MIVFLSSCTVDDKGEFHLTWLFWAILGAFVVLMLIPTGQDKKNGESRVNKKSYSEHYMDMAEEAEEPESVYEGEEAFIDVKGTYYRTPYEIAAASDVEEGDTLILQPEPFNPKDPDAVKVLTLEEVHIGYVQWYAAKKIKDNINHIKSCTVTYTSERAIPDIHAKVIFSEKECKQQVFIPEDLRVSPKKRMRDLEFGIQNENKYMTRVTLVEGTYEFPYDTILKARALRQGDEIKLKKPAVESKYFPYRLDVYTEDGCMIGFIHGEHGREMFEHFDEIVSTLVESPLDAHNHGQLAIKIFLPEYKSGRDFFPEVSYEITFYYSGPYPQLAEAESLKRTDQEKALEIALPIAEKEKGIDAKFLCCQIYRLQKEYDKEHELILKIIERIETIKPDEISRNDYAILKTKLPIMKKRLATVESRLNSKSRNKSTKK